MGTIFDVRSPSPPSLGTSPLGEYKGTPRPPQTFSSDKIISCGLCKNSCTPPLLEFSMQSFSFPPSAEQPPFFPRVMPF